MWISQCCILALLGGTSIFCSGLREKRQNFSGSITVRSLLGKLNYLDVHQMAVFPMSSLGTLADSKLSTSLSVKLDCEDVACLKRNVQVPRKGIATAGDLRRCLEEKYQSDVKLLKDGAILSDDTMLDKNGSDSVSMFFPIRGGMSVQVLTMLGEQVTVDVNEQETVLDLKKKLSKKQKLPVEQQRIIYEGKLLEDNKTLAEYNIKNNTVIHMVVRLRGGQ